MTISQREFYELPEIKACIEAQKANPFGSEPHRNAHIEILRIAEEHGVSQYFETIEQYDE